MASLGHNELTHWSRVMHICVSKLTIIGSDNGFSPGRHQAIIWTNAGILLIGPLGINFNETSIEIHTFSLKKIHLKLSSGKWRPFCLGLNVLIVFGCSVCSAICYMGWLLFSHRMTTVKPMGGLVHKSHHRDCVTSDWRFSGLITQNINLLNKNILVYLIILSQVFVLDSTESSDKNHGKFLIDFLDR